MPSISVLIQGCELSNLVSTESAASMDSLYRSWSARAAAGLNRRSGNLNEQFGAISCADGHALGTAGSSKMIRKGLGHSMLMISLLVHRCAEPRGRKAVIRNRPIHYKGIIFENETLRGSVPPKPISRPATLLRTSSIGSATSLHPASGFPQVHHFGSQHQADASRT